MSDKTIDLACRNDMYDNFVHPSIKRGQIELYMKG